MSSHPRHENRDNITPEKEIEMPIYTRSGLLAKEPIAEKQGRAKKGILLDYFCPSEAARPGKKWSLVQFKKSTGKVIGDPISLNSETLSYFLFGSNSKVAEIYNPFISAQHCVIQFRMVQKQNKKSLEIISVVKPFLYGLVPKTLLNEKEIPLGKYIPLKNNCMIRFPQSDSEYLLMSHKT